MNLGTVRTTYYAATRKLTELTQTGCFAGIAAAWAMKEGNLTHFRDSMFAWPVALFVLSLALNYLQFAWRAQVFGFMARQLEKAAPNVLDEAYEQEKGIPAWINRVNLTFVYLKVFFLSVGFFWLAFALT